MESRSHVRKLVVIFTAAAVLLLFLFAGPSTKEYLSIGHNGKGNIESWCPLPEPPSHVRDGLDHSSSFAEGPSVLKQVERLSAAVNVSTVSYNDNGEIDEDPRWKPFEEFHDVLRILFPFV